MNFLKMVFICAISAWLMLSYIGINKAHAVAPEAGEVISVVSSASYFNTASGAPETISSNTVQAIISAVPGFTITGPQTGLLSPNAAVSFTVEIINTGNTVLNLVPALSSFVGDFSIENTNYGIDTNNNGIIEPVEAYVAGQTLPALGVGESVSITISGEVSQLAQAVEQSVATLTVEEPSIPLMQSTSMTININTTLIELTKSASLASAFPGDEFDYTIVLENPAPVAVPALRDYAGQDLTLDGVEIDAVILRDRLPESITFVDYVASADFTPAFHLRGADTYSFVTTIPVNLKDIDEVVWVLQSDLAAGARREVTFTVMLDEESAGTDVVNVATLPLPQADGSVAFVGSNISSVISEIPADPGTSSVKFFTDPDYDTIVPFVGFDESFFLEVRSSVCNTTNNPDTIDVVIETSPSGDREVVQAFETGANTSIFQIGPLRAFDTESVTPGDNIISTGIDDVMLGTPACDPTVIADVPVETVGTVFVSVTNEPLEGVTVELFGPNGVLIASTETDAKGRFALPLPTSGEYRVQVSGLDGFQTPSVVTNFAGTGRTIDPSGSYSQTFTAASAGNRVDFDIPVDPPVIGALSVQKSATKKTVQYGETVTYTVEVNNNSTILASQLVIRDTLPKGFNYLKGSARVDGVQQADPVSSGDDIIFDLEELAANSIMELTYAVRVGVRSGDGRRVNRAKAEAVYGTGAITTTSNEASHVISVRRDGGVFSRDGVVLGKVFLDCDLNGEQGEDEPGIPGVQLNTQEGVYAVTDSKGRFSLPRLQPQTHIIDVYEASLPEGAYITDNRVMDAGNGGSRFVPLVAGEVRSEDFAVAGCASTIKEDVAARVAKFATSINKRTDAPRELQFDNSDGTNFNEQYEKTPTGVIIGAITDIHQKQKPDIASNPERGIVAAISSALNPQSSHQDISAVSEGSQNVEAVAHQPVSLPLGDALPDLDPVSGVLAPRNIIRYSEDLVGQGCAFQMESMSEGIVPQIDCWIDDNVAQSLTTQGASAESTLKLPADLQLPMAAVTAGIVSPEAEKPSNTSYENTRKSSRDNEISPEYMLPSAVQKYIETTVNLEEKIDTYTSELDFVDLENGDVLARSVVSIRVKGPAKGKIKLLLNGQEVSRDRLGQSVIKKKSIQAEEYVSIKMTSGSNVLALIQTDPFGNVRGKKEISITVPGEAAQLQVLAPVEAVADPLVPVPVILRVVDENNLLVTTPVEVTLSATEGVWDVADIRDQEPGIQAYIDQGEAIYDFQPSAIVGTHQLNVKSQFGKISTDIQFAPNLGVPPVFVGFVEGAFKFGEKGDRIDSILSTENITAFEETQEGVNGEVYLKGTVKGDALLTLRYDSDKDTEARLFRDVDPDRFYPVYGDTSETGFDARSSGELFVKVEKGQSYILYGDVRYAPEASAFQLGGYQRSLEGGRAHIEKGRVRANFYAAQTSTVQQIVEIPARGVSGPYDLDFGDVIENSEVVELITRDREQPTVILSTEPLTRFKEYTLDYFSRSLLFSSPVDSVDEFLNPVSIRVTFETEEGNGEKYWVYGGEVLVKLTDAVTAGYRELRSETPDTAASGSSGQDQQIVRAAFVEGKFANDNVVQLEVAQTNATSQSSSSSSTVTPLQESDEMAGAVRVSWSRTGISTSLNARLSYAEDGFNAPNSSVSGGSVDARVQGVFKTSETTNLAIEGLYTENTVTDESRYGAVFRADKQISQTLSARMGARYSAIKHSETSLSTANTDAPDEVISAIAGANWTPSYLPGASIDLEIEQAFNEANAFRVALGADYNVTSKIKAYLQSEWTSSDTGQFGILNNNRQNTTIRGGIEYQATENITAFSEYRANQSIEDAGLANGVAATYDISESLRVRGRVEHVEPLTEVYQGNSAASLGSTWEPEGGSVLIAGDVEYAVSASDRESWYVSNTVGLKTGDMTLLARNRYAISEEENGDRVRDRLRVGAAWRPGDHEKINGLAWYEYGVEDTPTVSETRHLWSVGAEFKPAPKIRIRPRIAGQNYTISNDQFEDQNTIHLAQVGADRDITDRVNIGVNIAAIADGNIDTVTAAAGIEANVVVMDNVLFGVGYNHVKLETEIVEDLYNEGLYARMRVKFDEDVWDIFGQNRR